MRQKFSEATGRDFDESQKGKATDLAKNNEKAEVDTDKAQKTVKAEINKALKQADDYTEEELANLKKLEQGAREQAALLTDVRILVGRIEGKVDVILRNGGNNP